MHGLTIQLENMHHVRTHLTYLILRSLRRKGLLKNRMTSLPVPQMNRVIPQSRQLFNVNHLVNGYSCVPNALIRYISGTLLEKVGITEQLTMIKKTFLVTYSSDFIISVVSTVNACGSCSTRCILPVDVVSDMYTKCTLHV